MMCICTLFCVYVFKDTFKDLFKGESASQRGTMYHIKNVFGPRSAKKHVMADVDHAYNLMDLCTYGCVCLALLQLASVTKLKEVDVGEERTSG